MSTCWLTRPGSDAGCVYIWGLKNYRDAQNNTWASALLLGCALIIITASQMVSLDFRLHLSSVRGAKWSTLSVTRWFHYMCRANAAETRKTSQANDIHNRRTEELMSQLNDTCSWVTGNLFFPPLPNAERRTGVAAYRETKKLQISARQAIPRCSGGLCNDLQSPCHSSEGTLTSRSQHQWGRHLVAQTFKERKRAINGPCTPGQVQNVKAARLRDGFPPCSFRASIAPLNSRQTDKGYICFSQRNVTGHSCYKTSITVTTSAVTTDTGGRRTETVHTAQLLDGDEEMADVGILRRLWTQSDGGSAVSRAPGPASSCRRPRSSSSAGGDATAAGRAERVHLLWSHCVWLTVRGRGGGGVSAFWMSRLVHVLREVTTRTPLWLFYQWVIFQLLSFSGENAWQNHYGSHHHIKSSEWSHYRSEPLKTVFSDGYCKWVIAAIGSLARLIQKHENNLIHLNFP